MVRTLLGALSVMIALSACSTKDKPYDTAWAACDEEARAAVETSGTQGDQVSPWIEDYTRQCMAKKGF